MKKWLDKYENGGEFLGTTNKGFDYNGAWGGTMQMGGGLPGATGMMYARVGAPANGKYAKKTKASAQNGRAVSDNTRLKPIVTEKPINREVVKSTEVESNVMSPQEALLNKFKGVKLKESQDRLNKTAEKITAVGSLSPNPLISIPSGIVNFTLGAMEDSPNPTDRGLDYLGLFGSTPSSLNKFKQIGRRAPFFKAITAADALSDIFEFTPSEDLSKRQNGGEMKFYQEGLDWKPKNISRNGSEIKKAQLGIKERAASDNTSVRQPRTDMLTMSEMKKQQREQELAQLTRNAIENQPVVQPSLRTGQFSAEEIKRKNKEYAQQTGKKFNENTGAVSPRFSPQQEKTLKKVEENIVLPMLALENVAGLHKLSLIGAEKIADLMLPTIERGIKYIDDKVVSPIVYRNQIAEIKKLHELAPKTYSSGPAAERLKQVLGIDPLALEQPSLTFDIGRGSHYNPYLNSINMDMRQIKELSKTGRLPLSARGVYDHEYGHFLQREADRFGEAYAADLARYEEQLAKYNDPENVKMLSDPETWLSGKNRDKVVFNPGVRPTPTSMETKIDKYAMNLYEDQYRELRMVDDGIGPLDDHPSYNSRAINNIDYFYNRGVEPMAHLREMRRNMLDKDYIKDLYEPISGDVISKFIKENPIDRVSSFTPTSPKYVQGLEKIFRNLPVAVPAVGVGAAAALEQKEKGGKVKRDDMGYWNPENWGEPVEIDSNQITMQGVYEPLIGISDTGDVQYMEPGEDYEFDGDSVIEYPLAKSGMSVNNADAQPIEKLDQLLNFTNYNKPTTGGWLDKYQ